MDEKKRAGFQRLVQASLLMEEASNEAGRVSRALARAHDSMARISEAAQQLHDLAAALGAAKFDAASRMAARLAEVLVTESTSARAGLEQTHNFALRSSKCTQEASTLIKVA